MTDAGDDLRATSEDATSVTLGAAITHAEIEDRRVPDPSRNFMPFVASRISCASDASAVLTASSASSAPA